MRISRLFVIKAKQFVWYFPFVHAFRAQNCKSFRALNRTRLLLCLRTDTINKWLGLNLFFCNRFRGDSFLCFELVLCLYSFVSVLISAIVETCFWVWIFVCVECSLIVCVEWRVEFCPWIIRTKIWSLRNHKVLYSRHVIIPPSGFKSPFCRSRTASFCMGFYIESE